MKRREASPRLKWVAAAPWVTLAPATPLPISRGASVRTRMDLEKAIGLLVGVAVGVVAFLQLEAPLRRLVVQVAGRSTELAESVLAFEVLIRLGLAGAVVLVVASVVEAVAERV